MRGHSVCVRVCALCVHASLLESSIVWGPHQIASIFGVVAAPSQCMRQKTSGLWRRWRHIEYCTVIAFLCVCSIHTCICCWSKTFGCHTYRTTLAHNSWHMFSSFIVRHYFPGKWMCAGVNVYARTRECARCYAYSTIYNVRIETH